jgi:hypothetical protein
VKLPGFFATVLLLVSAAMAPAQQTGFSALFIAGKSSPGSQLVEITGDRGSPQPQEWKFFYLDPSARGGVREITIANRAVLSERTPLRGFSDLGTRNPIALGSLKVDSDRAFEIANAEAVKRRIGFHWVDYTLRVGGDGSPRWTLRLLDNLGVTLGSLEISAESGAVVSPLSVSTVSPTASATPRPPIGGVIGTVRDVSIGVGQTISNTVLRTIGTGQEILTGERTIGPKEDEE